MPARDAEHPFLPLARFATDVTAVFTPRVLHACSACAGDYEDPDRTAGGEDESSEQTEEIGDDVDANSGEFSAEEE